MVINPPTKTVWYICVLLLVIGIVLTLIGLLMYGFIATTIGLILLLLATMIKGL